MKKKEKLMNVLNEFCYHLVGTPITIKSKVLIQMMALELHKKGLTVEDVLLMDNELVIIEV